MPVHVFSRQDAHRGNGSAQGESGMALLELKDVSKHFGAIHALNDVSLSLEPGQVVGLMGDNGAGKSTLVKIVAGNFRPTHGTMQMEGQDLSMHRPIEARRHGIEIVHQDLAPCDNLSTADRLVVVRRGRKVADKDVAAISPEEVTGLITGAIEHVL